MHESRGNSPNILVVSSKLFKRIFFKLEVVQNTKLGIILRAKIFQDFFSLLFSIRVMDILCRVLMTCGRAKRSVSTREGKQAARRMCRIQRVKWQVLELIFCVMVATPLGYKINIDKRTDCPSNTNVHLLQHSSVFRHTTPKLNT